MPDVSWILSRLDLVALLHRSFCDVPVGGGVDPGVAVTEILARKRLLLLLHCVCLGLRRRFRLRDDGCLGEQRCLGLLELLSG